MAFDTIADAARGDDSAATLAQTIGLPTGEPLPFVVSWPEQERAQRPAPARLPTSFMADLTERQRAMLAGVNKPGLTVLRDYIAADEAIAVLGPGVSAPLYPGPADAARELINEAAPRLSESEIATCRQLADDRQEDVVEMLRSRIGEPNYWRFMDRVFSARADPVTGRTAYETVSDGMSNIEPTRWAAIEGSDFYLHNSTIVRVPGVNGVIDHVRAGDISLNEIMQRLHDCASTTAFGTSPS